MIRASPADGRRPHPALRATLSLGLVHHFAAMSTLRERGAERWWHRGSRNFGQRRRCPSRSDTTMSSGFVVDLYCPELRLCIEIDGGVHERTTCVEYDRCRPRCWLVAVCGWFDSRRTSCLETLESLVSTVDAGIASLSPNERHEPFRRLPLSRSVGLAAKWRTSPRERVARSAG